MKTNNTDMKFKHTPGPWTASFGQRDAVIHNGDIGTIAALDNEMVAWKDNARLLAAAPTLLAALDRIDGMLSHDPVLYRDILQIARDAIDKAQVRSAVSVVNTHAFNAAFAAAQLSERIGSAGRIATSEKIAAAAIGIADAEAKGVDWGQVEFDSVCDAVAKMIKDRLITPDSDLEDLRQDAADVVRKEKL